MERVYDIMHINVDPCSPDIPTVVCDTFYTKKTNGLDKPWYGNVYLNPPYGKDLKDWVNKLCSEIDSGNVKNALVLVPHKTDTKWFRQLSAYFSYVCAFYGRVKYLNEKRELSKAGTFASCLLCISKASEIQDRFISQFIDVGMIYRKVEGTNMNVKINRNEYRLSNICKKGEAE